VLAAAGRKNLNGRNQSVADIAHESLIGWLWPPPAAQTTAKPPLQTSDQSEIGIEIPILPPVFRELSPRRLSNIHD
jgi:hypothetical protein